MSVECEESNIEQTLFLGCSVQSFNCNLGFNEQPTEVNIKLVRDTCSPVGRTKVYYDIFDNNNIRKTWTGPDPGLNIYGPARNEPPQLGAPVYFRFADFEFMGILQSWTKIQTKTDIDVYDVKIVSPTEILEGCQLIVGDYAGPIKGFNIFNVYGFQEVFSPHSLAPTYIDPRYPIDGAVMGSYANAFGGSNANKIGMTWNKIREGLQILTSSLISARTLNYEEFSQVGRIAFYGGQANSRFGLIPYDEINLSLGLAFAIPANLAYYFLDISELPAVPDQYRIAGPSISILSLISQITNDFGMDYYLELLPVKIGSKVIKVIKIRTLYRNLQPDTTIVQSYIDAVSEVVDSSFGRELRNENTTTFLMGGQKQNVIQVENGLPDSAQDPEEGWFLANYLTEQYVRDRIVPYFGKDTFGNAYVLHTTEGSHIVNGHLVSNVINDPNVHYINFDLRNRYNWIILDSILPDNIPVTIGEMRAASQGYDSWSWHSKLANTVFNQYITGAGYDIDTIFNPNIINDPNLQPRDFINLTRHPVPDQFDSELRQYVKTIGDIYLQSKQTFMVRIPYTVARYSIDSTTIANSYADLGVLFTDEPCDGGWTEADNVLYLPNPSTYVDRMRLEDGTIKPFAVFDLIEQSGVTQTTHTISEFETQESFAIDRQLTAGLTDPGTLLYYSFKQQPEIVFLDRVNLVSPRVIIQFSQPLDFDSDDDANSFFGGNGWGFNSPFLPGNADDPYVGATADVAGVMGSSFGGAAGGFAGVTLASARAAIETELMINKVNPPVREPDAVAITLKSNVYTYGPWKPDNIIEAGPPGQTRVEKQDDLVPWHFGSFENLDTIAQVRANESVTVMNEGEVGSITVFGTPNIPLGAELASLQGLTDKFFPADEQLVENRSITFTTATLFNSNGAARTFNLPTITYGSWNGAFGPTVTSISINFGTDGITTTYGFRTFTPKYGVMSKLNAQRLEQRAVYENQRRAYLRFMDESRRIQQQYMSELKRISSQFNHDNDIKSQAGSPHSVLAAHIVNWNSGTGQDGAYRRALVATKDLYELQNNLTSTGYDNYSIMSFDGLVRPVSMDGAGGLPRYINNSISTKGNSTSALPPFKKMDDTSVYNYNISLNYLNPFSNPSGFSRSELKDKHSGKSGHDIDILARGTIDDIDGPTKSLVMSTAYDGYNSQARADYKDDYRPLALRGPLLLQGWGYDTDGKPVPNSSDIESDITNNGTFKSTGLTDRFLTDFLRKPHTWPVAPVDLRLDRKRNVWTAPPPYDLVVATLIQDIDSLSSGNATISVSQAYDSGGGAITQGKVVLHDKVGSSYTAGSKVFAYYNTREDKYDILAGGGGSSISTKIVLIDQDITGVVECSTGTIDNLDVWGYTRRTLNLKYYIPAESGEPCYSGTNTGTISNTTMLLATIITGTGSGAGRIYDTISVYYDDGKDWIRESYGREDYSDYPENETFPPDGNGTYAAQPSSFFKKRYRGISLGGVLITSMCKPLPPPQLTTG